jgi:hypothetical protein
MPLKVTKASVLASQYLCITKVVYIWPWQYLRSFCWSYTKWNLKGVFSFNYLSISRSLQQIKTLYNEHVLMPSDPGPYLLQDVRALFYTVDMNMFLPVRNFQDCMKIQSALNKMSEWCERNSLVLNVDKCKTITFSTTRYPVEFAYMLAAWNGSS